MLPLRITRPAVLGMALLLLVGCANNGTAVLQHLDPETGATISRASAPVVFYRDMSSHSAHGRDYVYMGPVQVNTMGRRDYFLWLGIWGTSDSVDPARKMDDFETVVLYADGEPFSLELNGWSPGSIGASGEVYVKPVASAIDGYYRVTLDQLRLIAESRDLELSAGAARPQRFQPWDSAKDYSSTIIAFLRGIDL